MKAPIATYRLQINSKFRLQDVKRLIPYLDQLGISTIYAAPIFTACPGSTHGYDGVNVEHINPEIGTLEELKEIAALLKERNMNWMQDIVPNHMGYHASNQWLMDVFEKGADSEFATFFDIDWQHAAPELRGKLLAPLLGEELTSMIQKEEVKMGYDLLGFHLLLYNQRFPLSLSTYYDILVSSNGSLEVDKQSPVHIGFQQMLQEFKAIQEKFSAHTARRAQETLAELYKSNAMVRRYVETRIHQINKNQELFNALLQQQHFHLTHGTTTNTQINYRRFFTVNELICLRMEEEKVFDKYHAFTKTLLSNGCFQFLRIDHIDGLYNPLQYLQRIRALAGAATYIVAEKILESEESMPTEWPIEGTSGYDFLAIANRLFTNPKAEATLENIYQRFTGIAFDYEHLVEEKKAYMLGKKMGGEVDNLVKLLEVLKLNDPTLPVEEVREALFQWMLSFPIYRTYVAKPLLSDEERSLLSESLAKAQARFPKGARAFTFFRSLVLSENSLPAQLHFLMRLQQFTGPLAAKGVEDTVFYVYNRLISHNEVGDSPRTIGLSTEQFHQKMQQRQRVLPLSINTTSTHDTKRGEDARMRIHVLSELPNEWEAQLLVWKQFNASHKVQVGDVLAPVPNDEYFLYQSLLGGFPIDGVVTEDFRTRTKDFMLKALREAKVYTDYPTYNVPYENATMRFIDNILSDPLFLNSFVPFFEEIADRAIALSIAQVLVKITAPGIPDIYQGSELWETSYVDPDNRREIDFQKRSLWLEELIALRKSQPQQLYTDLVAHQRDGKLKLYTTHLALQERKAYPDLFEKGSYLPLDLNGHSDDPLLGYARQLENQWMITVVPRKPIETPNEGENGAFGDIRLPENAPQKWTNVLTGEAIEATEGILLTRDIFRHLPLALLRSQ